MNEAPFKQQRSKTIKSKDLLKNTVRTGLCTLPSAGPPALWDKPPHSPGCLSGPRASSPAFPPGCETSAWQTFSNMSTYTTVSISVMTGQSINITVKVEPLTSVTATHIISVFRPHRRQLLHMFYPNTANLICNWGFTCLFTAAQTWLFFTIKDHSVSFFVCESLFGQQNE